MLVLSKNRPSRFNVNFSYLSFLSKSLHASLELWISILNATALLPLFGCYETSRILAELGFLSEEMLSIKSPNF